MSEIVDISDYAIGTGCFERALDAGEFETCRAHLARSGMADGERAAGYCRLGEALYYRGRREDAVACARAAFDLLSEHKETTEFCAWVFSNCDCHEEAAAGV